MNANLKRHRILIVDDLEDNRFLLQVVLQDEGYDVEQAESGEVAWRMIQSDPPDLVLLDVMMPGLNGLELTDRLRKQPQFVHLPIVLISAQCDFSQREELGATACIQKPVDLDILLDCVRQALPVACSPRVSLGQ